MLFNSVDFLVFGLAFFVAWYGLRNWRVRLGLLVAASFFFYGFWDWRFVSLLLISGLIDFYAALAMARRPGRKRLLLLLSLTANLGLLGTFKYLGFFVDNLNGVLSVFGASGVDAEAYRLILPVGISFYTFQSMSYTIDVYRGELEPTESLLEFFAFLSMFPQLVAGPIVRARDMLPQIAASRAVTGQQSWDGWRQICVGFFKKCVIADNLAPAVNAAFEHVGYHRAGGYWWLVSAMFAYQIYCDFSGYSDIACGLGKLMGFEFPQNFNHPYVASSFRDFWGRWHISLSSWFRDYVYIPLGGNRRHGHRNLWLTMLLSGLWHGAAWTFIAWGALHALYASIERLTGWPERLVKRFGGLGRLVAVTAVFGLTLISWVLFRAESIGDAAAVVGAMLSPASLAIPFRPPPTATIFLAVALVWEAGVYLATYHGAGKWASAEGHWGRRLAPVGLAALALAAVYLRGPGGAFIYFQF